MNNITYFRPVIVSLLFFTVLFGALYPAVCTGIIQLLFSNKAQGSLITKEGKTLGSELIAQQFTKPEYFWGRPSAAGYNAAASSGSNLGPANPALLDAVKKRVEALKNADPDNKKAVPVDLVTASGSGLDPHISLKAAEYQVERVARTRGIPTAEVAKRVKQYTEGRQFGIFGEPRVNVLKLNLALDGMK